MNNFIKEVLSNENIMKYCFDYDKFNFDEKNKNYLKESFEELIKRNDKILNFIIKNTEFLYMTSNRQYIGTIEKFVIYFDDEFSLRYLCHGFENIPTLFSQDKDLKEKLEIEAKQNNINYSLVENDYLTLIDKYNIQLNLVRDRNEFEKFLNKI